MTRLLLRVSVAHGGGRAPTKGRPNAARLCGRINSEEKEEEKEEDEELGKWREGGRRRRTFAAHEDGERPWQTEVYGRGSQEYELATVQSERNWQIGAATSQEVSAVHEENSG